jgi:hypothetical protein
VCQSRAQGGRRCATHTRRAFTAALSALHSAGDDSTRETARIDGTNAVLAHASTRRGRLEVDNEVIQAEERGDTQTEAWLTSILRRAPWPPSLSAPDLKTPPPMTFTDADRQPQDTDQSFGISDHTTRVDPRILIPYRDKDASTNPRDPARMDALRADVAEHGIGNPLALFHDGKRACLAEGNHRLGVALEQTLPDVPLRIIRLRSLNEVSNFAKDSKSITAELRVHLR